MTRRDQKLQQKQTVLTAFDGVITFTQGNKHLNTIAAAQPFSQAQQSPHLALSTLVQLPIPNMSSSSEMPDEQDIKEVCKAIGELLAGMKYCIIGGGALQLLESPRLTRDVDILVPRGSIAAARARLAAAKDKFFVDPRIRHTYYKNSNPTIPIDIVAPPMLFKVEFDDGTPLHTVPVDGQPVDILKPSLILNSKCVSVLGRSTDQKKQSDASDIIFLLEWLTANNVELSVEEVPHATAAFIQYFIAQYQHSETWRLAGFKF